MAGSVVPAIAAAALVRARRRIAETLMAMGAVSADAAVPFHAENDLQRRQLEWMLKRGIVHPEGADYWLDLPAWDAAMDKRRGRIAVVFGLICIVLAVAALIGYRLSV